MIKGILAITTPTSIQTKYAKDNIEIFSETSKHEMHFFAVLEQETISDSSSSFHQLKLKWG